MRECVSVFFAVAVCFLGFCPADAGTVEKAGQMGEDFQRQMPYSRERPSSGETAGQPQPGNYSAPPEGGKGSGTTDRPQAADAPLCYNPYYGTYEPCYPRDSDAWRLYYNSPQFLFWWERSRSCPPGYLFKPGRGCYRY